MPSYDRLRDTSAHNAAKYIRGIEERLARLEAGREAEGSVTQTLGPTSIQTVSCDDTVTITTNDPAATRAFDSGSDWDEGEFG